MQKIAQGKVSEANATLGRTPNQFLVPEGDERSRIRCSLSGSCFNDAD